MDRTFKVGDKVKIPKTKSRGCSLSSSHIVDKAKRENQDYLFIIRIDECYAIKGDTYVLHWRYNGDNFGGDYYVKSDLEHYEEFPEKWAIELYPEVKKWINDKFKSSYYNQSFKSDVFHFPNWENEDGFLAGNHSYFRVKEGYTLITLEQFQKHLLKEKEMERKIIGYVLIKEYPGSKGIGYFEKYTTGELSKYPEFWKPVYEEEPKVGDWVTIIKGTTNDSKRLAGRTLKIKGIDTRFKYIEVEEGASGLHYNTGEKNLPNEFRKATPEEIEAAKAAQKTIVKIHSSNKGMFEIEVVDGKAYYRPDNRELPKKWIKTIIDLYDDSLTSYNTLLNPYEIKIASIKVGCMEGTRKEDWEKVYKLLK